MGVYEEMWLTLMDNLIKEGAKVDGRISNYAVKDVLCIMVETEISVKFGAKMEGEAV